MLSLPGSMSAPEAVAKSKSVEHIRKILTEVKTLTLEEHREWARKIWDRIDRDGSQELTVQELNCDEFQTVFRSLIAPLTAGKGVAGYERSEINLPNALNFCMRKADKNNDGILSFEEFEFFLRSLRNERSPEHIANVTFALFDLDCSNRISLIEFREIYRYFLGHDALGDDLTKAWRSLDVERHGEVTKAEYCKWLRKRAGPVFVQEAPRVLMPQGLGEADTPPSPSRRKKVIFRPAPGLIPPRGGKKQSADDFRPVWSERFASKDLSEQNIAFRGNMRMKSFFSRPQSLPDLHRYYCMHSNFEKNRQKLLTPEPSKKMLVLSGDNQMMMTLPGFERHKVGGTMKNTEGDVVPWREMTPRALIRPKWEPGSLLLRVPGPPAPFLVKGRGADDD